MKLTMLPDAPTINPRLRMLVSACRSGSTAVLTCFAQHPEVQAIYQNVKTGLREGKGENYELFYATPECEKYLIDKETLGPHNAAESALAVFPEEHAITVSRPVFLFRDPVATWNSWYDQGWQRYKLFELAYTTLFQTLLFATAVDRRAVLCIAYELLVVRPEETIKAMCSHWGVAYRSELLDWRTNLEPIRGGADFKKSIAEGSFARVQRSRSIEAVHRSLVIPPEDVDRITAGPLAALYLYARDRAFADLDRFGRA